ncbi:hypothetical protein SAMN05192549_106352 [Duganella sacchari]|jgi:hypothetical protein|uniref:Uncharacterized protein n=1 Tax=Duganella sacchari TaxID=551987 RepID=A0A1M7Q8A9_9BURK|nr:MULTISPECIES: hypothetical protein [Duganella]SHN26859.1 hypothetical protein SAMN05192549_106352 [Duganella sacchari]
MSTALQIKVVTLLGYVALSTALVLMLADDEVQGAAQALFAHAFFR